MSRRDDAPEWPAPPIWDPPRPRRHRRREGPTHALVLAVSALVLFLLGWLWLAFFPGLPVDLGGVENLDHVARPVRIPVAGADTLDGWYLGGTRPAGVLLLHGYGRTHHRMWRYGRFLYRAGYAVLAIDFRSARERNRRPTTLGRYELEDAQAALRWLGARRELRGARIGALGESLGGSIALILAADHLDLAAVVDDSGFESGRRAVEDALGRTLGLPTWVAAPLLCFASRVATGWDPCALDVLDAAARLRTRPVLFVHGLLDPRISPDETRHLWRAAGAKDSLWLVAGAGHNEAWITAPREYERRVLRFFGERLLNPASRRATPGPPPPSRPGKDAVDPFATGP